MTIVGLDPLSWAKVACTLGFDGRTQPAKLRAMVVTGSEVLAGFGAATGAVSLARRLNSWRGVLALNYHRIGYSAEPYDHEVLDATPAQFDEQVRYLVREFDLITPAELEAAVRRKRGRYVLITFDDGYRDTFAHAVPILKRHGATATLFVTTGFVDNRQLSWWDEIAWMVSKSRRSELEPNRWLDRRVELRPDRHEATRTLTRMYKNMPGETGHAFLESLAEATGSGRHPDGTDDLYMTWDDIRELRAAGWQIGGHTITHPILARLSAEEQEHEIAGCKARIETKLGEPMRYFSYPNGNRGSFNDDTRRCLADHGVEYSFSFYCGYRRFREWDPYDVRRRWIGRAMSQNRFAMTLALPQLFA